MTAMWGWGDWLVGSDACIGGGHAWMDAYGKVEFVQTLADVFYFISKQLLLYVSKVRVLIGEHLQLFTRQWWRLRMSEKFSSGIKKNETKIPQTHKYTINWNFHHWTPWWECFAYKFNHFTSRCLSNFSSKCQVKVCCVFKIFVWKYQDSAAQNIIEFK